MKAGLAWHWAHPTGLPAGVVAVERCKAQLAPAFVLHDRFILQHRALFINHGHKGLAAGRDRRDPPLLIQGQRKGVEGAVILSLSELSRCLYPLDKIHLGIFPVIPGMAAVTLHHSPGVTGSAGQASMSGHCMFRCAGYDFRTEQSAALLDLYHDITVNMKDV
jgi:hypothetical protein